MRNTYSFSYIIFYPLHVSVTRLKYWCLYIEAENFLRVCGLLIYCLHRGFVTLPPPPHHRVVQTTRFSYPYYAFLAIKNVRSSLPLLPLLSAV